MRDTREERLSGGSGAGTWFRVWLGEVRTIKVQRATESSVWVNGRRRSRSGDDAYFPTLDEAVACIVRRAGGRIEIARRQIEAAEKQIAKARALEASTPHPREASRDE